MYKEIASAVIMTVIIAIFAIYMQELTGEAREVPSLLLCCMGLFNGGQYVLAANRMKSGMDKKLSIKGYPLQRVGILGALTVLYIVTLEFVGFYPASFAYFVAVSLIAQPMAITPQGVIRRLIVCGLCIGFLYVLFTVLLTVQIPKGFLGF